MTNKPLNVKPKRWNVVVAEMPALTKEQTEAVKKIVDYHLCHLVSDFPKVDEAHYEIQRDLDGMGTAAANAPRDSNRCACCGWPLVEVVAKGCVRGNCSMRPMPDRMYDAERYQKEQKA